MPLMTVPFCCSEWLDGLPSWFPRELLPMPRLPLPVVVPWCDRSRDIRQVLVMALT
jgi:hypothetical protein